MPLRPVQFATKSHPDRSPPVTTERLLNLYADPNPPGSKSIVKLLGTPGLKSWKASVGNGPIRGMTKGAESTLIVVSGNECYWIDQAKNATLLGTIADTGEVRMSANRTQAAIVSTNHSYVVDFSASPKTLQEIAPTNQASDVTYIDGYGIFSTKSDEIWFISSTDDFTTFNGAEFTSADAHPDDIVGILADHRELVVLGRRSIEHYYNTGASAFPFERVPSGYVERGCGAKGSIQKYNNAIFWLGDDLRVYTAQGYQPHEISTDAVDKSIAAMSDPNTCSSMMYTQEGHTHYVINWSDGTWVYDLSTGLWHERQSYNQNRWRAQHHVSIWGKHLVGDFSTGDIYELDLDTYDDNGTTIRREAVAPPIHGQGQRLSMSRFFVDMEAGKGLDGGVQGSNPDIMLDYSDDGGRTFGNERWAKFGKVGEYGRRATWNRLGHFYDRQIRVAVSDPVKTVILGAYAEIEARA